MDTRLNYSIANDIYEAAAKDNRPRSYLGMSQAGHVCNRHTWFKFRQFTPIAPEPRIIFLFRFGDKIEELVCTYLRQAGYKLENAWPDPQAHYSALGGILSGHSDGIIHIPEGKALLECKSAKAKKFQAFVLAGVKATNPIYYWQAQLYMGCGELERALFVIVNKDNSNIHTEIVPFNKDEFYKLIGRIRSIVTSKALPDMEDLPDCKYCDYRLPCKTNEAQQLTHNCMTCTYLNVSINSKAEYHCGHPNHQVQIHHTEMSCPEYSWIGTCPF